MNIKIKKLTDTAVIPTRCSDGAAGFDLYADSVDNETSFVSSDGTIYLHRGESVKIHTGISMAIPDGYVGLIFARSGLACKKGLRPSNCVGVIDSDYRGEIIVSLYADMEYPHDEDNNVTTVCLHDRIAQIVFVKYEDFIPEITDRLDDTTRGDKGFGSTGL